MPWQPFRRKGNKHRPLREVCITHQKYRQCFQVFFSLQDEDETSFAQEMTVPRSYSDGNLVRFVSVRKDKKWEMTGSGHQAKGCYWEIGLPSAVMALVVVGPATGQALLSECSSQIGLVNIFNESFMQCALLCLSFGNFQYHVWWTLALGTW